MPLSACLCQGGVHISRRSDRTSVVLRRNSPLVAVVARKGTRGKQTAKVYKAPVNSFANAGPLLAKATSNLLQNSREADSIVYDVALLTRDHEVVKAMKEATAQWNTKIEEASSGTALPGPRTFLLGRGTPAARSPSRQRRARQAGHPRQGRRTSVDGRHDRDAARAHREVVPGEGHVHQRERARLAYALRPPLDGCRETLVNSLLQIGGGPKVRRAPAGGVERDLDQWSGSWASAAASRAATAARRGEGPPTSQGPQKE